MKIMSLLRNKIMALFIVTLPLIAFGVPLGQKTVAMSYVVLFLMLIALLAKNALFPIDTIHSALILFVALAAVSAALSIFTLRAQDLYVMGDDIYAKEMTQVAMLVIAAAHLIVLRSAMSNYSLEDVRWAVDLFMAVCAVVAVYALYQYVAFMYDLPFSDILRNSTSYSLLKGKETSSWVGLPRVRAFMPEPSFLGVFLLIPISLAIPMIGTAGSVKLKVFLLLYVSALILSFSRSSWFILCGLVAYYVVSEFIVRSRSLKTIPALFAAAVFASILFWLLVPNISDVFSRLTAFSDRSAVERIHVQKAAAIRITAHPWLGVGWGNTPWVTGAQVTHNFYLQLLLETGIIGFSAFITFLLMIWRRLSRIDRIIKANDSLKRHAPVATGLRLAFLSIVGMWFNLPAYNFSYTWFVFAIIASFPAILIKSVPNESIAANQA